MKHILTICFFYAFTCGCSRDQPYPVAEHAVTDFSTRLEAYRGAMGGYPAADEIYGSPSPKLDDGRGLRPPLYVLFYLDLQTQGGYVFANLAGEDRRTLILHMPDRTPLDRRIDDSVYRDLSLIPALWAPNGLPKAELNQEQLRIRGVVSSLLKD